MILEYLQVPSDLSLNALDTIDSLVKIADLYNTDVQAWSYRNIERTSKVPDHS